MKTSRFQPKTYAKVILVFAGFILMIVYAGGFLHDKTAPDALHVLPGEPLPEGAELIPVTAASRSPRVEVIGTTASDRRIQISARMSAYVDEVLVNAGDRVTNGQPLVVLDRRELREQMAAGEAQFNQASAEYRRTKQLFDRNAATEQAMTAAQSGFTSAKANVERIKIMLTYATITSPINGIVTERKIEAGDLASPGLVLLSIFDPVNMRLEVPVPVRLINKFALGQKLTARLDHPEGLYDAEVTEIVGEIDPLTRTRRVKLRLLNTDGRVLPGTYGRIWVEESPRTAIVIPARAVQSIGQLDTVNFVRDNRIVKRLVRLGDVHGAEVEILSGLDDGDLIAVTATRE